MIDFNGDSQKNRQLMEVGSRYLAEGIISGDSFANLLEIYPSKDPFEKWSFLATAGDAQIGNPDSRAEAVRSDLIGKMILADASHAMDQLLSVSGDSGATGTYLGVAKWVDVDPAAANDWFKQKSATLSERQRDMVAGAFSKLLWTIATPQLRKLGQTRSTIRH